MDTIRIQDIASSVKSIKNAKFYNPNWAFIGFQTGVKMCTEKDIIRTAPLNDLHKSFTKELNDAIRPVLDKYAKIFEDEISKCCSQL